MPEQRIHYLALSGIKRRLDELHVERGEVAVQLEEARAFGDLRENSEYDAAKEAMGKIVREIDELTPALSMQPVKANPNASVIEEGCVLRLTVVSVTPEKMTQEEFLRKLKDKEINPQFSGILMFGGTVDGQDFLKDRAMSATPAVGSFLRGKQPGFYSIPAPGGYSNVYVEKLTADPNTGEEFTPDSLLAHEIIMMS